MSAKSAVITAAAMAGLFAGSTALVGCSHSNPNGGTSVSPDTSAKHACKGLNACKGQGNCKTGDNGCKGQNSCKGKGGCKSE